MSLHQGRPRQIYRSRWRGLHKFSSKLKEEERIPQLRGRNNRQRLAVFIRFVARFHSKKSRKRPVSLCSANWRTQINIKQISWRIQQKRPMLIPTESLFLDRLVDRVLYNLDYRGWNISLYFTISLSRFDEKLSKVWSLHSLQSHLFLTKNHQFFHYLK